MEYNDIYDENRRPTGRLHRRGTRWRRGEYGLVVCVWVYDGKGNLLLTRRAPQKSFAGTWENSGGAAKAGETSRQAIARELFEETGIRCDQVAPLYEDSDESRLYRGFLALVDCDKASVRLQIEEAVDYCWVSKQELAEMLYRQPSPVILHQGIIRYLGL